MGQEFFIKSPNLEDKVKQLLPSQGGLGAGFDLSASTQIVPIVDLTESAEGSNIRADLQTALSFNSITAFSVANTTTTIVNNTGYFRVFGTMSGASDTSSAHSAQFNLVEGATTKRFLLYALRVSTDDVPIIKQFDFVAFLAAGQSLEAVSNNTVTSLSGCTRQIADIDGNLINP